MCVIISITVINTHFGLACLLLSSAPGLNYTHTVVGVCYLVFFLLLSIGLFGKAFNLCRD